MDSLAQQVLQPLFIGTKKQRYFKALAKIHEELGGVCSECGRESDVIRHSRWNPSFSSWRKKKTNFEVHHPDNDGDHDGVHRAGEIYIPTPERPGAQHAVFNWWVNHLRLCELTCWSCHAEIHKKVHAIFMFMCCSHVASAHTTFVTHYDLCHLG